MICKNVMCPNWSSCIIGGCKTRSPDYLKACQCRKDFDRLMVDIKWDTDGCEGHSLIAQRIKKIRKRRSR